LPESALASRNFAQKVKCLKVRLLESGDHPRSGAPKALSKGWGTIMRSRKKFAIKLVVARHAFDHDMTGFGAYALRTILQKQLHKRA
jgi:hypothetical protein